MNKNPFTLLYGMPPQSIITRNEDIEKIVDSFSNNDNMRAFLITGIRGCGKTVLLRNICQILGSDKKWIIIDVNPQGNIENYIAQKLFSLSKEEKLIDGWEISLNLGYLTLTKGANEKINDPEIIISDLINKLNKHNKKILLSIDEVNNTPEFKKFVNYYQILIGNGLPVYLLMTAIYENTLDIINDKAMTFLSRAPKIDLNALPLMSIALEYKSVFDVDDETSKEMAKLTNGYAFAYQVLGYLFFERHEKNINDELVKEYEKYLWNNGYNKFWNDATKIEKEFLIGLALSSGGTKEEIIANSSFSQTNYSQYRKRLLDKGLIVSKDYNKLSFVLPRFKEYVLFVKDFE